MKILDWVSDPGNTRVIDGSSPNGLVISEFIDFDTAVLDELPDGESDEEIAKPFRINPVRRLNPKKKSG